MNKWTLDVHIHINRQLHTPVNIAYTDIHTCKRKAVHINRLDNAHTDTDTLKQKIIYINRLAYTYIYT